MPRWNDLTPEQKAAEFDASYDNPAEYARANFDPIQVHVTRYEQTRTEQREQQQRRRES